MNFFIKICLITFLFLALSAYSNGQAPPSKISSRVLFSINKGEKPLFPWSSIELSRIGTSVTVFTTDEENRVYVYENGKKRGPFRDVLETAVKLPDDNPAEYDPVLRRESDADYEKYIEYNEVGEITLKFAGKSFGPYQFILELYTTNDKSAFSAIVMNDGKPQIITSSGVKINLDGQPTYNYVSASGKKMMVTVIKENNATGNLINKDLSRMSPDEIAKLGKEMEGKQIKPPEAFIYFQDGKKYGPYDPKKISANNPAFSKTGGDNWLLTMDSKLYINGTKVKDLINENISPANIWLTEDGKKYAVIVYNRIEFSDGSIYKDPLKIRISVDRNNITIWWLLFENEKDIVLYSKTI